ncbi:copper resistance protein NlpE [Flavobacterium sp.]|uniref:copper resistance protein NlpE n=1 Tax=Flavobacterium sp. TaxID=239 RepID=UPI00286C04E3|nr:copper resistance protein NlpE [Flavobacterium sp.]
MKRLTTTVFLLFVLISCKKEMPPNEATSEVIKDTLITKIKDTIVTTKDNSNTALDWAGVYKGVTPCADCEGIETEITLNKDLTYKKTTKYLGKSNSQIYTVEGSFEWNSNGIHIALSGIKDAPNQYLVGENKLFQLDRSGNKITGYLASKYI